MKYRISILDIMLNKSNYLKYCIALVLLFYIFIECIIYLIITWTRGAQLWTTRCLIRKLPKVYLMHWITWGCMVRWSVCTMWQSIKKMNADSFGILHGVEEDPMMFCEETDDRFALNTSENPIWINGSLKNTICITGFGVEDSCSFLQFQKYRRVQDERGMFARVLASSIVELVGFFVGEGC